MTSQSAIGARAWWQWLKGVCKGLMPSARSRLHLYLVRAVSEHMLCKFLTPRSKHKLWMSLLAVYEQAPDMSTPRRSVVTCLRQWRPKLVETGFQELVFEDALEVRPLPCCLRRRLQCAVRVLLHFCDFEKEWVRLRLNPNPKPLFISLSIICAATARQVMIDQLNSLGTAEPLTVRQLEDNLRDASLSPMIVMMLRMLDSAEIQRRGDFFYPFILVRLPAHALLEQLLCVRKVLRPGAYATQALHTTQDSYFTKDTFKLTTG